MRRIHCLIFAALIVGFTADLAPAQIGRGRLLKKMRDDIFGSPEDRAREEAAKRAAEQKRKIEAQRKAQLEAQRRAQTGRQPTPVNQLQRQQALQQQKFLEQQRTQLQRSQAQRAQQSANASRDRLTAPPARQSAKQSKPQRKGFGFVIVEKGDKLIVTEVVRGGNADEAGLKRGDQIVGIGGVDIENEESFEEIAEILNPGDNIEIAFKRSGRTDEVQIGFGRVPEGDEEQIADVVDNRSDDFAPAASQRDRATSVVNGRSQRELARQVERLNDTVLQQRQVIERLQNQLRALQQTSAPRPNAQVPPIRSGKSILETRPDFSRSNR